MFRRKFPFVCSSQLIIVHSECSSLTRGPKHAPSPIYPKCCSERKFGFPQVTSWCTWDWRGYPFHLRWIDFVNTCTLLGFPLKRSTCLQCIHTHIGGTPVWVTRSFLTSRRKKNPLPAKMFKSTEMFKSVAKMCRSDFAKKHSVSGTLLQRFRKQAQCFWNTST